MLYTDYMSPAFWGLQRPAQIAEVTRQLMAQSPTWQHRGRRVGCARERAPLCGCCWAMCACCCPAGTRGMGSVWAEAAENLFPSRWCWLIRACCCPRTSRGISSVLACCAGHFWSAGYGLLRANAVVILSGTAMNSCLRRTASASLAMARIDCSSSIVKCRSLVVQSLQKRSGNRLACSSSWLPVLAHVAK